MSSWLISFPRLFYYMYNTNTPSALSVDFQFERMRSEHVRRVLAVCGNPRAVLELGQQASHGDIRAAYRRVSRLVHPDMNSDSRAASAFTAVGDAQKTLLQQSCARPRQMSVQRAHTTCATPSAAQRPAGQFKKTPLAAELHAIEVALAQQQHQQSLQFQKIIRGLVHTQQQQQQHTRNIVINAALRHSGEQHTLNLLQQRTRLLSSVLATRR